MNTLTAPSSVEEPKSTSREQQFVLLTIGEETYGVEIGTIHGIIMPQTVTEIPKLPAYIKGVTNLRGKVLPVIDMRTRFGLPPAEGLATRHIRFVIIEINDQAVGLIVDSVSEVARIAGSNIEPPSMLVNSEVNDCLSGVGKLRGNNGADRLVMILDVHGLLGRTLKAANIE